MYNIILHGYQSILQIDEFVTVSVGDMLYTQITEIFFFKHSKTCAQILSPLVKICSATKEIYTIAICDEPKQAI